VHPTEPSHVYLIGAWNAAEDRYVRFLGRGAADEERIFREFLDYVGGGEDVRLYHWTDYETGQMSQVAERWPQIAPPLKPLLASCVDLMRVVKSAVYLPVPTFSLKCVAPALGFAWRQEGFGAFDAMVCYWDYLDRGDAAAVAHAIAYNEDDCRALWHVDRALGRQFGEPATP
jgi:predicted RecB family nuclease